MPSQKKKKSKITHYIYSHIFLLPDIFSKQTSLSIFICFYQTFKVAPAAVDYHSSLLGVKYGERKIIMYSSKFRNNKILEWVKCAFVGC